MPLGPHARALQSLLDMFLIRDLLFSAVAALKRKWFLLRKFYYIKKGDKR